MKQIFKSVPIYNADFYSDGFIKNPWPHYTKMRSLGPVIYLPKLGNYALTQYSVVQEALRNYKVFASGQGVSGDAFGSKFLRGNIIASDPPRHHKLRRAMSPPLMPKALKSVKQKVDYEAQILVDELIKLEKFDGINDFANHLPLTIVKDLVGLPEFGQNNMLEWAAAAFDIIGVQNKRGFSALEKMSEMRDFIAKRLTRGMVKKGSLTDRLFKLVEEGALEPELAPFAIRDYIGPSLDTTISATGHLIRLFSQNLDQWHLLRKKPELCKNAVNEVIRLGSPIRSFSRTTTETIEISNIKIPKNSRVMILFASANRDESVFERAQDFIITRDDINHLGFGHGIHACMGMYLAQMEMVSLLQAMLPKVRIIKTTNPKILLNNTICGFSKLPTRFII
ncbi:MAG: cytochrome [Rhodobacteraceae bacterium]|nr:cytochrome [Paracoccaceae bacterium]|tara:strand:+ start:2003 stop:3187 length:1185 start_codon:yes stop_codon:yes gene_type:complete